MNFNIEDLELIHFADERMKTPPPKFDFEKDGDKAEELGEVLHQKMVELGGVGLSANQVGLPYRVFVFGDKEQKYVMFNPELVGASKEQSTMEEGCLSFPELMLVLKRPAEVMVKFQDEQGEEKTMSAKGAAARIILHEYDHMLGINFTYYASNFKLKLAMDKIKKRWKKEIRLRKRIRNGQLV